MTSNLITADQLVAQARMLCDVPWRHQGRGKNGVDCIGLVVTACKNAGLDLASYLNISDDHSYGVLPSPELLERVQRYCTPIEKEIPGCLLFFSFPGDRHPRHFAIYTASGTMIHATSGEGRVVEHGYRGHWLRWTRSKWLLPGVAYASP